MNGDPGLMREVLPAAVPAVRRGALRRRARSALAGAMSAAVVLSLLTVTPAEAALRPAPGGPALTGPVEPVNDAGRATRGLGWPAGRAASAVRPAPVWPGPGTAQVVLDDPKAPVTGGTTARPGGGTTARVVGGVRPGVDGLNRAGGLPVAVGRADGTAGTTVADLTVDLLDRTKVSAHWRDGLLLRVTPGPQTAKATAAARTTSAGTPATARVSVDYNRFRYAHGADWASRLRLWQLPDCAERTPERAECAARPLPSNNDIASTSVSAVVPLAASGTLLALAATASGAEGDFGATPLAPSATWSSGGSTGDFTWSYPMRVPPAVGGPAPSLALSYSSAAVDGMSDATNNQPSWIGEGFDLWPGYIERRYVSCAEDMAGDANNTVKTGDLCWRSDNATMSLNGRGSELVFQAGKGWHARSEDGSRIEKLTDADNGDNDQEYWKVTTPDGMQYYFGLDDLPGQTSATNSANTVRVYGNHPGEPCNANTFAASGCTQVWRWNLDYVVDPRGNTMSYWYAKETNRYAARNTATVVVPYTRASTLSRIDYGTWDRGDGDRSVTPSAQVLFETADRCAAQCANHDATHWPDVPWDQKCDAGASTCDDFTPTFWSTKRLAKITTQVWDTTQGTAKWQPVDSWTLDHSYPPAGDGSDHAGLWLNSVVQSGLVGGTVTLPPVTFEPVSMPNRVLKAHNTSNNRQRMANIVSETGARIQVSYSLPDCTTGNLPSAPHTNTRLCYPVIGPDPTDPEGPEITEWWHKYVVTQVSASDLRVMSGDTDHGAPVQNTFYTYVGAPAWHYADDDGLVEPKRKTWNQFRGFGTVEARRGDQPNQTLTRTTYLRGMHGDRSAPSGGTRDVTAPASLGTETVKDEDQFAGLVREQVVYDGVNTKPITKTVNVPWMSPPTASRTINGDTVTARFSGVRVSYSATALGVDGQGGWRVTRSESKFDDTYGMPEWTQDDGDTAKSGDERCVTYTYNRNTAKNLLQPVKRQTTTALACGTAPSGVDDVISDVRNYHDGAASPDTAPTVGAVTKVEQLKDWTAASGTVWQVVSEATYDPHGRPVTATDLRGNTTTTTYTPGVGGPLTKVSTSVPDPNGLAAWVGTVETRPYWGAPTKTTDMNGRTSELEYDPLGRLAKVWQVGWAKTAQNQTNASIEYSYVYSPTRSAYPYVTTRRLHAGGGYLTSYQIYDAFLRPRQTQVAGVGGDRVITDTIYDQAGRVEARYGAHAEPGAPDGALWWVPEWSVPSLTKVVYDRASRPTDEIFYATDGVSNLVEKWRTTTRYLGNAVSVTPPDGATPTTTITDAQERTVEVRQHTTDQGVDGAYQTTSYTYNRKGQLTRVADPAGNEWTYAFDAKGRQVQAKDPDKGLTTSRYNDEDELVETKDANNKVLAYEYDNIGRKIGLYEGAISAATKRAAWIYDKISNGPTVRNQLTQAIRYEPAGSSNAYTWRVVNFDTRYNPTGIAYVIPAVEGTGLAGTWQTGYGYSPYDGTPTSITYPGTAGLTTEQVTTSYDATTGLPADLKTNASVGAYVASQQYTRFGEPTVTRRKLNGGDYVDETIGYELATRRVEQVTVTPETGAGAVSDRHYDYDEAGNVRSIRDTPAVGTTDNQCFAHDKLRRLVSAWTPRTGVDCDTAPTLANLDGPAPYWLDWTFDKVGNRLSEVAHVSAGDVTRTYTVPTGGPTVARPHAVTAVTTEAPGQAAVTTRYGYDDAGNMTCRPTGASANTCPPGGNSQALLWDAEGRLSTISGEGQSNIYDAFGNRLIRRDSTGTTLYVPGQDVRRASGATTATATRYYSFAGRTVASRTPSAVTWLYADHQGTQHLTIQANNTQVINQRRQLPYGGPRGVQPVWPTPKGFVGGDTDPTGLTHLGAREYDPNLGRFISVDPLQDMADPQQWNAYSYANNSPVTLSDPSGLRPDCGGGTGTYSCGNNGPKANGQGQWTNLAPSVSIDRDPNTPKTTEEILDTPVPGARDIADGLVMRGYGGSAAFTWRELLEFAAESTHNWVFICTNLMGADSYTCETQNPLLPERSTLEELAMAGVLVGALACSLAGPACWGAAVEGELAFYATGSMVGSAGLSMGGLFRRVPEPNLDGALRRIPKSGACSFAGDTRVLMADGGTKPISEIKIGDEVLATDPETGERGPRRVTNLWVHEDVLRTLSVDGARVVTTEDHPFWNVTDRQWQRADALDRGDLLLTAAGLAVPVDGLIRQSGRTGTAFNLTVGDIHTYYVMAGETPVLVHNTGPCGGDRWSSGNNLNVHFDKHGAEMGYGTKSEYDYAARDLMCTCDGRRPGVQIKQDGATRYYFDAETGEFGVTGNKGIVTYYKADQAYFDRQPGSLVP